MQSIGSKLAAIGYAFLVFDTKNFSNSEGKVRNYESIHNMIFNTSDAISFLRTLKFADRKKFYGHRSNAGSPYICNVAFSDIRINAVATLVGNIYEVASLSGNYPKEMLDKMLALAAKVNNLL